jgi:deoxyuridine 5'-triphosphate nucleotidohydrolase
MSYFAVIDSELKAYMLGLIVFNINKVKKTAKSGKKQQINDYEIEVCIDNAGDQDLPEIIGREIEQICAENQKTSSFTIKSRDIILDICKHLDLADLQNFYSIDITYFVKNNQREFVIEFLKAFYEKYGNLHYNVCNITTNSKLNLTAFAEFFQIPHTFINIFNLVQLTYANVNIIDLLGIIYKNKEVLVKEKAYTDFLTLLNNERPALKYIKIDPIAVTPTKAHFSDVGYDVSILGLHKVLVTNKEIPVTALYRTGIKLDIPMGYYVELVPRSSISKSGYVLANSIGIIDCSYKGELLVALTKINGEAEIEYPFKCCQLIMRKQIFPDMIEINEMQSTTRSEGGFGSSN